MKLFNEVQVMYIEENEPAWKKHIAESYRLYEGESYKLAFLMAFIGLDSLIELLNDTIKDVYLKHENDNIEFQFKHFDKSVWTPIKILREEVLVAKAYKRLEELEKQNRKLVKEKLTTILRFTNDWDDERCKKYVSKFSFFNDIRNCLAHGSNCDKNYIKKQKSYYNLYKEENSNDIDFDKLYVGLLLAICKLIEDLRN